MPWLFRTCGPAGGQRHLARSIVCQGQGVVQKDGRHEGFDLMPSVVAPTQHFEEEVDFRRRPDFDPIATSANSHPTFPRRPNRRGTSSGQFNRAAAPINHLRCFQMLSRRGNLAIPCGIPPSAGESSPAQ